MTKAKWDLTSANSVEAAARWICKDSCADLVLVVRRKDCVIVAADDIRVSDVSDLVWAALPEALERLGSKRRKRG